MINSKNRREKRLQ